MDENEWSEEYLKKAEEKEFECDGKVVDAHMEVKTLPTGEDAKYLVLTIRPTSYSGEDFTAQYRISDQPKGKWIHFRKALRDINFRATSEKDLMDKEFHWVRRKIGSFTADDGNDTIVNVYLPVSILGEKPPEKPIEKKGEVKLTDMDKKVLDWLKENGGGSNKDIADGTGLKLPDVIKSLNKLKASGKVVLEQGVNILKET